MIRINLLPVRAIKKKRAIRKQVTIFFVSLGLLVLVCAAAYLQKAGVIGELTAQKEELAAKEAMLRAKVKEVDELKKEEEDLQAKLKIIADLENRRTGPVRILDEISRRTPAGKAYLVKLAKEKDKLTLNGVAMDNETIAVFMSRLEASEYLRNVELVRSSQEILNEMRLKSFSITCDIVLSQETPGEEEGQNGEKAAAK